MKLLLNIYRPSRFGLIVIVATIIFLFCRGSLTRKMEPFWV
jgi:hypothetical protein